MCCGFFLRIATSCPEKLLQVIDYIDGLRIGIETKRNKNMIHKALFTMMALLSMTVFASESTQQNKQLVVNFYNEVILQARHSEIDNYIGEQYIQHNPNLPDGKDPLRNFLQRLNPESTPKSPSGKIIRAVAEGDLVVLHVKYFNWPTERGGAVMDIFRVDEGKIVEHWDVIQAIPETSANDNTMF